VSHDITALGPANAPSGPCNSISVPVALANNLWPFRHKDDVNLLPLILA